MKKIKIAILLLVLLSCREKKPPSHYHYTSIVIVGKDTIEYIDGTTNYTKVRHYSANGHNDTVSSTFFDTIWLKRPNDTVYIHDTIYITKYRNANIKNANKVIIGGSHE